LHPFARLLDRLLHAPQRNTKLRLIVDYFRTTPDPDRGYALAALTGSLDFRNAKPGLVRELAASRSDPELFAWSYDFIGDLAETTALLWPDRSPQNPPPALTEIIETLKKAEKAALPGILAGWLDSLDADGRWALLKLITGGLRVGVSARLAKLALAEYGRVEAAAIEEVWHGLEPPYGALFAWLDGRGPRPDPEDRPVFRPLMLAHPLEAEDVADLDLAAYAAEWKWDGIRVQIASRGGEARLYARSGDDISTAFPDIVEPVGFEGVLDGELLVKQGDEVASFNALQQRLGRKSVTAKLKQAYPAFVQLYDILFDAKEDLRPLPFLERRARLEAFVARERPRAMAVSPLLAARDLANLDELRRSCRGTAREGIMLKRKDSPYLAGRPKGLWFKWKRDALSVDCVLMYAQRGHGKRSSFYSDYTFGVWREDGALVPVGKAYFGFTDEELRRLDRWVREHTTNRFGPVREVEPGLVLEIAFDSVHRSSRHKAGLAMRFPRVHRIRWDKPAAEADGLAALARLAEQ